MRHSEEKMPQSRKALKNIEKGNMDCFSKKSHRRIFKDRRDARRGAFLATPPPIYLKRNAGRSLASTMKINKNYRKFIKN